jgi:hypothetical protein
MEYSSHTYPRELAERIISEWSEVTNPLDGLPPKEALVSLLSEAFQASLLREESRPIKCRLVLINPCELREAEGPPTGMQVLQLQVERKLRAQEIRRLSPCATFYRSLIAVRLGSRKGLLDLGHIELRHPLGCSNRRRPFAKFSRPKSSDY